MALATTNSLVDVAMAVRKLIEYHYYTKHFMIMLRALQVSPYYTLSHSNTGANYQFSFIHPSSRTNVYKYSFYSKTINHWNDLSSDMVSAQSPAELLKLITIAN